MAERRLRTAGARWRLLAHERHGERRSHGIGPLDSPSSSQHHVHHDLPEGVEFDELVVDRWMHVEQMNTGVWWMNIGGVTVLVSADRDGRPKNVTVSGPGDYDDPVAGCSYGCTWSAGSPGPVTSEEATLEGRAIPEAQALVDAVDAMLGDHPAERCPCDEAKEAHWRQFQTEPAPETYRLCNGCGVLLSDPDRDDGCPHCGICGLMVTGSGPRCGRPAGHGGDCAPSPVAADPAEPNPEPQSEAEAEFDVAMAAAEPVQVVGTRPPWRLQAGPPDTHTAAHTSQPAPEPDSGIGFDRSAVEALLARSGADATDHELRQVVALLADCDRSWATARTLAHTLSIAAKERDAARTELAEVTADRNERITASLQALQEQETAWREKWQAAVQSAKDSAAYAERGWAEVERLRGDLDEYRATFELGFRRMGEAVALRRAEAPQEREPTQPDLGDILKWLMDRAASAYREGAADALAYASRLPDRCWTTLRDLAAKVRTGEVTIPASNEEATPDGE